MVTEPVTAIRARNKVADYFIDRDALSINDAVRAQPCERGPIRVLLVRDGQELLRIQTFAGPLANDAEATSLGEVPAPEASAYLLGIASRVDGRPGRDAIMPAMLAEGARYDIPRRVATPPPVPVGARD